MATIATPKLQRMTFEEYQAIDAINWSLLKEMDKSPRHFQHRKANPREDKVGFIRGRAAHTAVFEPERFLLDYVLFKGDRRAGKAYDALVALHPEETILKTEEYETALAIKDSVRSHPVASRLLAGGKSEVVITWTDPATGLACKARIDHLAEGAAAPADEVEATAFAMVKGGAKAEQLIRALKVSLNRAREIIAKANGAAVPQALVDLKTGSDLDAFRFGALAARMGYHGQLAFYRGGLRALGIDVPAKIVAVEKDAPHDVAVFDVTGDEILAGEDDVRELLGRVVECQQSGEWPGRYVAGEERLVFPRWFFGDGSAAAAAPLDLVVDGQEV
jgi:exodeoxyribonuclease VIII